MKKSFKYIIWILVILFIVVYGWFSFVKPNEADSKTVTIGIMSGSRVDDQVWNQVTKNAKKDYGLTLKFKKFTDYSQPNRALTSHDVDINAFQTPSYCDNWNKSNHTNIKNIGFTYVSPLRLYSKKIKSVKEIPNGATISVPNDASNEDRALKVLQSAGLIKLDTKAQFASVKSVISNPKHIKIKELDAAQTASSLSSVTASVINGDFALSAQLPTKYAIYREPLNKNTEPYFNVISVNGKDKNNKVYKEVVKAYQQPSVAKVYKQASHGLLIPAWNIKLNK